MSVFIYSCAGQGTLLELFDNIETTLKLDRELFIFTKEIKELIESPEDYRQQKINNLVY